MINLLICGDYYPCHRVSELITSGKGDKVFQNVQQYIQNADLSIVNLEYPVVHNDDNPIKKCGPNLKGNENSVQLLENTYSNRICKALAYRHLLPRFLNTKRIVGLLNYINCESHREKMVDMLQNLLKS